ncbi:CHAT domain-containing protein [Leucothrix arctica]|uniref:Uncharacterized protein n=1 Tax=Leucothrix arctica TaxID=1481894 RepID=A0A317C8R4_9GAMM|nr:CHAT domain-containing protein [Leucothrix arctica]PWQ94729.1 hypothetical protein DKT75_15700 [Leucothrix arctica]
MPNAYLQITLQSPDENIWPVTATLHHHDALPHRRESTLKLEEDWESKLLALDLNSDEYGEYIGRALFNDGIFDITRDATKNSYDNGKPTFTQVFLNVEAKGLKHLKWERLCFKNDLGQWESLAQHQQLVFSYYIPSLIDRRYPVLSKHNLHTLAVISSPSNTLGDYHPFDIDTAKQAFKIEEAYESEGRITPPVTYLCDKKEVSWESLLQTLNKRPYPILHIVAHGFYNEQSKQHALIIPYQGRSIINEDEIVKELGRLSTLPNLIVLSCCETATPKASKITDDNNRSRPLALRLLEDLGTPAVIAMSDKVSIDTAHTLTKHFYGHLTQEAHVDIALSKAGVSLLNAADRHMPVLYQRLGSRPLFTTEEKSLDQLTPAEIKYGCDQLGNINGNNGLIDERAPALTSAYKKLYKQLDISKSASEQQDTLRELDKLTQETTGIGFAALAQAKAVASYDARCPFPGLRPFKDKDTGDNFDYRPYFFGRETKVKELTKRLDSLSVLMIKGDSGSGKSSIVYAGVLPAIDRQAKEENQPLVITTLRPHNHELEQLNTFITQINPEKNNILFVDQFEEIFTTHLQYDAKKTKQAIKTYVNTLLEIPNKYPLCKVVLTMRVDFSGDCAPYENLRKIVQDQAELLPPMNQRELRTAIEQQADSVKLTLEQGLLQRILNDVDGQPGAMPLLQQSLRSLWNRRRGQHLRNQEYDKIKKSGNAIAEIAETHYKQYKNNSEAQRYLRNIYLRLTRPDNERQTQIGNDKYRDTRQRISQQELYPQDANKILLRQLIQELSDGERRLIVTYEHDVEIAHESLIHNWPRLDRWLNDSGINIIRQGLIEASRAWKEETDKNYKKSQLMHTGTRLEDIGKYKAEGLLFTTKDEEKYLEACKIEDHTRERNQRYVRILAVFFAVLLSISGIISWVAIGQKNLISNLDAERYLKIGYNLSADNLWYQASVAFAKAKDASTTEETKNLIHNAFAEIGLLDFKLAETLKHKILGITEFDNSSKLLVWGGNFVEAWDIDLKNKLGPTIKFTKNDIIDATPISNGAKVLTVDEAGIAQVWDLSTGVSIGGLMQHSATRYEATPWEPDGPTSVFTGGIVFNNEQSLLSWDYDGQLYLYDLVTGRLIKSVEATGREIDSIGLLRGETRLLINGSRSFISTPVGRSYGEIHIIEVPTLKTLNIIDDNSLEEFLDTEISISQNEKCAYIVHDSWIDIHSIQTGQIIDRINIEVLERQIEEGVLNPFSSSECTSGENSDGIYYDNLLTSRGVFLKNSSVNRIQPNLDSELSNELYFTNYLMDKIRIGTLSKHSIKIAVRNTDNQAAPPTIQNAQLTSNNQLIISYTDGVVHILDKSSPDVIGNTIKHGTDILGFHVFSKGKQLLTWGTDSARLWDISTTQEIKEKGVAKKHSGESAPPILLYNDKHLLTWSSDDGHAHAWDVATGKSTGITFPHNGNKRVLVSFDKKRFLANYGDTVQFWDALTFEQIGDKIKVRDETIDARLQVLGSSATLLFVNDEEEIQIYDAILGKVGVAFSHDPEGFIGFRMHEFSFTATESESGKYIFIRSTSEGAGTVLQIREKQTGKLILTSEGGSFSGSSGDFFSENKSLTIERGRKPIPEWSESDLHSFILPDDPTEKVMRASNLRSDHVIYKNIGGATIFPQGELILTFSKNSIRAWDAKTGLMLSYPMMQKNYTEGVRVAPDQKSIITWSKKKLYLWKLNLAPSPDQFLNEMNQAVKTGTYIDEYGQPRYLSSDQLKRCDKATEPYKECNIESNLWCKTKWTAQQFLGELPTITKCRESTDLNPHIK